MSSPDYFEPKWTPGPLAPFGEHKSEHGKFVYAVRETQPKGQIAGYPTPTARYRNRADAMLGALAPELAVAVLALVDAFAGDGSDEHGAWDATYACAERLRMIGADE